jgi:hypothetical protein
MSLNWIESEPQPQPASRYDLRLGNIEISVFRDQADKCFLAYGGVASYSLLGSRDITDPEEAKTKAIANVRHHIAVALEMLDRELASASPPDTDPT